MAKTPLRLREPKEDCILYSNDETLGKECCRGLDNLYCAIELRECPFYKSKDNFYPDGRPRKG